MATKKRASSKSFPLILGGLAVAGVAALGFVLSRPTKTITLDASLPPVAAAGILRGNPDAPVQVIEFADFECPGCGQFATVTEPDVVSRLIETGEVAFRFIDFPLIDIHPNAVAAHNAGQCANEQGKFWPMHDQIFARQHEWNSQRTRTPKKVLEEIGKSVGLDMSAWNECYDSGRMLPQIQANRNEAIRLQVRSTPTFIIGDQMVADVLSYDEFRQHVTAAKVKKMAAESEARQATKTP